MMLLIVLAAGILSGAAGFGLPALSVGLLAGIHEPRVAVATMVCPILITGLRQLVRSGDWLQTARVYWVLSIVMVASLWVVASIAALMSAAAIAVAIGGALVLFAATGLTKSLPRVTDGADSAAQGVAGLSCGIIGGLTAIWSPPIMIYLLARGEDRDGAVRQSAWFICLGTVPLAAAYWQAGLFTTPIALMSLLMCVPAFAGLIVGERIVTHFRADNLARALMLVLCLLAGFNLFRQVFA